MDTNIFSESVQRFPQSNLTLHCYRLSFPNHDCSYQFLEETVANFVIHMDCNVLVLQSPHNRATLVHGWGGLFEAMEEISFDEYLEFYKSVGLCLIEGNNGWHPQLFHNSPAAKLEAGNVVAFKQRTS